MVKHHTDQTVPWCDLLKYIDFKLPLNRMSINRIPSCQLQRYHIIVCELHTQNLKMNSEWLQYFRFVFHGITYDSVALSQVFFKFCAHLHKDFNASVGCLSRNGICFSLYLCSMFDDLGFTIHPVKFLLEPVQCI